MSSRAGSLPARSGRGGRPWGRRGLPAVAILYLGVMIVLPLSAVVVRGFGDGLAAFWSDLARPLARDALWLTLWTAAAMTACNAVMGTITAFVLVRYRFPGRGLLNAAVDLPFAIPTLVTGVMLVTLYGPQTVLGGWLDAQGVQVIFAKPGIVLALMFVCYPFVVRSVQPVLLEAERSLEEAAWTLGASPWVTFRRVILPTIAPAIGTGSLLAFARALGEFGSIVIVAGNIPRKTLTAPVWLYQQVEYDNVRAASAMSVVLFALSFALILLLDWRQRRSAA